MEAPLGMRAPTKKRILLVDDHPMVRNGLAAWIRAQDDLMVCAEADDAEIALDLVSSSSPDLVITDASLPGKSGLELIKDLRVQYPTLPVLVVSMHNELIYAERVLRAGGRGYVMKCEGGNKLMLAIRRVLEGGIFVSEAMSARVLESLGGRHEATGSSVEELTDREFEVFEWIAQGASSREIGKRLHLSAKTVDAHRSNIMRKIKISTVSELISFAARWVALH